MIIRMQAAFLCLAVAACSVTPPPDTAVLPFAAFGTMDNDVAAANQAAWAFALPERTANNPVDAARAAAAIDYLAGAGPYANREEHPMPCLVLLDLNMPGKSGLDVLKWIRTQPRISTLPIVVITSSNQDSDIHRAYLLGANGYLIKPGKPDELLVMVKGIRDYWLAQNRSPASWVNLADEQKSAPTNPQTE